MCMSIITFFNYLSLIQFYIYIPSTLIYLCFSQSEHSHFHLWLELWLIRKHKNISLNLISLYVGSNVTRETGITTLLRDHQISSDLCNTTTLPIDEQISVPGSRNRLFEHRNDDIFACTRIYNLEIIDDVITRYRATYVILL